MPRLIGLLESRDLNSRLGACQALGKLAGHGKPAVPALRKTLRAEELWLRTSAAQALGHIGEAAKPAAPDLLEMLVKGPDAFDPRGMQQRYLISALFDEEGGLLRKSLDGVDHDALSRAVRAGLQNQDGHARSQIGTIYSRLSAEQIELLLPAIHEAVVKPAPSGEMFADEVRLSGLEVLAKHHIKEGMALCLDLVELDRWNESERMMKCLEILQIYGGAAKPMLPRLQELKAAVAAKFEPEARKDLLKTIRKTVTAIESATNAPELRALPAAH